MLASLPSEIPLVSGMQCSQACCRMWSARVEPLTARAQSPHCQHSGSALQQYCIAAHAHSHTALHHSFHNMCQSLLRWAAISRCNHTVLRQQPQPAAVRPAVQDCSVAVLKHTGRCWHEAMQGATQSWAHLLWPRSTNSNAIMSRCNSGSRSTPGNRSTLQI